MAYDPSHSTVFAIYDLTRASNKYQLCRTKVESSTIDDLFHAFRTNLVVPPRDTLMERLANKVAAHIEASVGLALQPGDEEP
jgi:hypothetical protein